MKTLNAHAIWAILALSAIWAFGIEKQIMSRDRAGSGLKTHPVLEHCWQALS
jgi:hypothetical protein